MKDDPLKIRDVINVTHNTLHRGSVPLELGDEYWNMRDAIVQAELLIMRMLKFEVTVVHPHKVSGSFHCKNGEKWFHVDLGAVKVYSTRNFARTGRNIYIYSSVNLHMAIFCITTSSSLIGGYQHFGGHCCCFHHHVLITEAVSLPHL